MNVGTHVTHCCIVHGCKYAWVTTLKGEVCPVASGEHIQEYECEQCEWAKEEYEEAKRRVAEYDNNWFHPPYRTQIAWNNMTQRFTPYDGEGYS